jgi:hypothetical protein
MPYELFVMLLIQSPLLSTDRKPLVLLGFTERVNQYAAALPEGAAPLLVTSMFAVDA